MLVESHLFCKDRISLYHTSCRYNETSENSYSKNLLVRPLSVFCWGHEGGSQEAQRASNLKLGPSPRGPPDFQSTLISQRGALSGFSSCGMYLRSRAIFKGKRFCFLEKFFQQKCWWNCNEVHPQCRFHTHRSNSNTTLAYLYSFSGASTWCPLR